MLNYNNKNNNTKLYKMSKNYNQITNNNISDVNGIINREEKMLTMHINSDLRHVPDQIRINPEC